MELSTVRRRSSSVTEIQCSVQFSSEFQILFGMNDKLRIQVTNSGRIGLTQFFCVKLKRCWNEILKTWKLKSMNRAILRGSRRRCIGRVWYDCRRRVTAAPAGRGKVKRNGRVCLGVMSRIRWIRRVNNALSWEHVALCGPLLVDKCECPRTNWSPWIWWVLHDLDRCFGIWHVAMTYLVEKKILNNNIYFFGYKKFI